MLKVQSGYVSFLEARWVGLPMSTIGRLFRWTIVSLSPGFRAGRSDAIFIFRESM